MRSTPSAESPHSPSVRFFAGILLFSAYVVTAHWGLTIDAVSNYATLVWAPSGIALAFALVFGVSLWPAVALGAFVANLWQGAPILTAGGIAFGNTLSCVVAAAILSRMTDFQTEMSRVRQVAAFIIFGSIGSTTISASIGVGSLWLAGQIHLSDVQTTWTAWWVGDALGNLLVTPLLLTWSKLPSFRRPIRTYFEIFVLVLAAIFVLGVIFDDISITHQLRFPKMYFLFPIVLWASLRFGPRGATAIIFLLSAVSIYNTYLGFGPVVVEHLNEGLLRLNLFLGILALTGLTSAATTAERREAITKLEKSHDELGQRVEERTAELQRMNETLRELERAASHAQEELKEYVDHMSTFNAKIAPDGRILMVNEATLRASGYSWYELSQMKLLDGPWFKFDPEVYARVKKALGEAARGIPINYDERIQVAGSRVLYLNFSLNPVFGGGSLRYILVEGRDITSQKQAEEKFRRVLEAAPDAMVIADKDGRIVLTNAQVETVFGYSKSELVGAFVETLIPERFRPTHQGHREDYAADPKTRPMGAENRPLSGLRKDGAEFPAEISLSPLQTEEGALVITAIRDVTDKKRAEEQRTKLAKAEEAIHLRDEFLAIASHELRTPLTGLHLELQLLDRLLRKRGEEDGSDLKVKLRGAHAQIQRLAGLLESLLDVSRITAGRFKLNVETVDFCAVVHEAVERFREEAENLKVQFSVKMPDRYEGTWDRLRIDQAVTNLLSNAMKYGAGKPIEVELEGDASRVRLMVRDQGIGIPPDQLGRIFDRFHRVGTGSSQSGLGLGLFIVRQVVEAHGGRIRVESRLGKGTTFVIELPRNSTSRPDPTIPARLAHA